MHPRHPRKRAFLSLFELSVLTCSAIALAQLQIFDESLFFDMILETLPKAKGFGSVFGGDIL